MFSRWNSHISWNQYAPLNKWVFNFDLNSVNDELQQRSTGKLFQKESYNETATALAHVLHGLDDEVHSICWSASMQCRMSRNWSKDLHQIR